MDALCISNAVRFCGLANGPEQTESCLVAATDWMQTSVSEGPSGLTTARAGQSMPSNTPELKELGVAAPIAEMFDIPDCEKFGSSDVSANAICTYGAALRGWLVFRVLERGEATDPTNLKMEK
ncbi:hypothetical protein [Sedimentitalea nanhaiensis]|uniref:Uncharacterized protein n=1 Tax=Sedimentitalea nanhaiensis TaxID=999627 RepID=A0A1I6ZMU7_9RHOB|nr:hypothetical protein [Sedimentitalea nanhaiensis]SFT63957.1 hypothetical protein SAMN05216236_104205 [Sedimentitalea nanhaiensis]